jgi:hypothetical protein
LQEVIMKSQNQNHDSYNTVRGAFCWPSNRLVSSPPSI